MDLGFTAIVFIRDRPQENKETRVCVLRACGIHCRAVFPPGLARICETPPGSNRNSPPERSQASAFTVRGWCPRKDMGDCHQRQTGGNSRLQK